MICGYLASLYSSLKAYLAAAASSLWQGCQDGAGFVTIGFVTTAPNPEGQRGQELSEYQPQIKCHDITLPGDAI